MSDMQRVRVALVSIAGLSWLYLVYMAWAMMHMDQPAAQWLMPAMMNWDVDDLLLVWVMWAVMMVAMMLPSALPMVQMVARIAREQDATTGRSSVPVFVGGYLAVWTGFSVAATLAQWGLLELRLLTPMMTSANAWFSGVLLIGAGLYQFTPSKELCLNKCRTPLGFLLGEWRPGAGGAFTMGLLHGAYCVGCCALLMVLLFVLGVMNLTWIAVLTLIVVVEKLVPVERLWPSRLLGGVLVVWGGCLFWIALG